MDGERITLRLEPEDLDLIDGFIEGHPEISNRSQLARVALRSFIERDGGTSADISADQIVLRLPSAIRNIMDMLVADGYYSSIEAIVEECLRKEFIPTKNMGEVKDELFNRGRQAIAKM